MLQWTLRCMYIFRSCFSLDICPGVGLQGHMVALFLGFLGTSILFSVVAAPVYIPTDSVGGSSSLHALSSIYCLGIFWWWPFWLVWGNMHCGFDLHFSNISNAEFPLLLHYYWFPLLQLLKFTLYIEVLLCWVHIYLQFLYLLGLIPWSLCSVLLCF